MRKGFNKLILAGLQSGLGGAMVRRAHCKSEGWRFEIRGWRDVFFNFLSFSVFCFVLFCLFVFLNPRHLPSTLDILPSTLDIIPSTLDSRQKPTLNYNLRIENERHSTPKLPEHLRICQCCSSNEVENEVHVLLSCNRYDAIRKSLMDDIISKYSDSDS